MIFRRKKADGFDWHHYVRTTLLLRRQQRRARLDEIGRAAAGQAQAVARAVGDAAAQGVAQATETGWRATAAAWRAAIALPASAVAVGLGVCGPTLLGWGLYRWWRLGLVWPTAAILVAGTVLIALAVVLSSRIPGAPRLPGWFGAGPFALATLISPRVMQTAVFAVVALGLGWFAWGPSGPSPLGLTTGSLSSNGHDIGVLEGRAIALSGEMIRLQGRLLHLSGIEAPDHRQTCIRANTKSWRCGEAALTALERLARSAAFRCSLDGGPDPAGRIEASCTVDGRDVAGELVRAGHVFSTATYFGGYAALESEARHAGTGVWSGTAERPADYRAKLWDAAKATAPNGCPIKGQIDGSRKTYLLPWSAKYDTVTVRTQRGERWFCDEASAQSAGFKPAAQRRVASR